MNKQFIVERDGRNFVLYAGLLDEAHQQGLESIETELIQIPAPVNGELAIVRAKVVTAHGTYHGIGDAAPDNVPQEFSTCLIRMAETRAKARALRDAVNIGMAALEELPDTGPSEAKEAREDAGPRPPKEAGQCEDCGKSLTLSQTQLSVVAFGSPLCPKCQQARKRAPVG